MNLKQILSVFKRVPFVSPEPKPGPGIQVSAPRPERREPADDKCDGEIMRRRKDDGVGGEESNG